LLGFLEDIIAGLKRLRCGEPEKIIRRRFHRHLKRIFALKVYYLPFPLATFMAQNLEHIEQVCSSSSGQRSLTLWIISMSMASSACAFQSKL